MQSEHEIPNGAAALTHARAALDHWGGRIGPVAELAAVHQKPLGDVPTVFTVTTARGERFILKDVAGSPDGGRLASEVALLRHLQAFGVPVAVPVPTDAGGTVVEDGARRYVLAPQLPVDHEVPPDDIDRVYANIGAAVSRLHRALAAYPERVDSWTMDLPRTVFEEAVPRIRQALTGEAGARFARVMAGLEAGMRAALHALPMQLIHGDCHGGNMLLAGGDVSGFIDLDHLPTGPRAYDIGYLLADMAKARFVGNPAHRDWLATFHRVVVGYEREQHLSRREKDALWWVMLATQVLFVDWFLQHGNADLARKNLDALFWIHEQGDVIQRRLAAL